MMGMLKSFCANSLPSMKCCHYPCDALSFMPFLQTVRRQSLPGTKALGATMNASKFVRRASLALCFLAFAGVAFSQATQTKQFEPQVGQAGKDVVWVPTPQALVEKMLDISKTNAQDYVMDLGSGDGRTVITAAKRGATAMGIEYNPDMVDLSKR